ncbi:hypothetical protein SPHINGO361_70034 [Sphingomonas sp. EC-HK361]|nr:hypothetical protein SPHINGO361_70034 [Sphingomonas sp. EC-HK361]
MATVLSACRGSRRNRHAQSDHAGGLDKCELHGISFALTFPQRPSKLYYLCKGRSGVSSLFDNIGQGVSAVLCFKCGEVIFCK